MIVPGGLGSILETIVKMIPPGVIKTGVEVTNIDWSGPGVVVTTETGEESPAGVTSGDNLIVLRDLQL